MLNSPTKFNREFCYLLDIDPNKLYCTSYIYDRLISFSSFSYGKYIFENKNIINFINNISGDFHFHFTKSNLINFIRKIKTESIKNLKNKYVIISNEISEEIINRLDIIL